MAAKAKKERKKTNKGSGEKIEMAMLLGGYDFGVVALVMILSLFGVAMVFSAGYYETINFSEPDPTYYLRRQLFFVATGAFLMFLAANINYRVYSKTYWFAALISLASLVVVMVMGVTVNNAQRWIDLGFIRITPSEFSKVFMIIFSAGFLAKNPKNIKTVKGLAVLYRDNKR